MSDAIIKLIHKELQSSSRSKHQEMSDYLEITKLERRKYNVKKMLLHTVYSCLQESELNEELKNKVRSILFSIEVRDCMYLKTAHGEEKLLGLQDLGNIEMSFNEQEQFNQTIHNKLQLHRKNKVDNTSVEEEAINFNLCLLTLDDKKLLDERKKLNDIQETYIKNLENMYALLQNLLQLRFANTKELLTNKMDDYALKSKMYHLRTEMVKEKAKIDIFNETSISLQAYKEFFNNISEQQNNCQQEITNLIELHEKYKLVACKEYNEILKSYLQYKNSIENKKNLYGQLNRT